MSVFAFCYFLSEKKDSPENLCKMTDVEYKSDKIISVQKLSSILIPGACSTKYENSDQGWVEYVLVLLYYFLSEKKDSLKDLYKIAE